MEQKDFATWLAELKDRNDIVSVVSSYVRLTRKGKHHWGCCPFHNEKTPSFSVNDELQIYKCFGCGEAGDVIKFVQKSENTDFNGAVQILADRAGMEIPKFGKENTEAEKKKQELLSIMKAAQEFFVKQLQTPQAEAARAYIKSRGLSKEIVERFGLGFAPPGWENLKTYLLGIGFSIEKINETGLMSTKDKRYYDKFRNRIMYPISDEKGNIISFGGRKINPEDEPKYMNCPQTLLYNKSQTLYALNIAKNYGRGSSLIIVEGYMDVISMHEFGFNTAVASCGTSLTQQQARRIKHYVDKVYIAYDGDAAGQKATVRGLDILKDTGLDVFVLSFPDGCDPDDTLRKYGKEFFDDIIRNAKRLEEFKIDVVFATNDLKTNEGRLKAAKEAIEIASTVKLDIERERYVDMIVKKTGYSERAVLSDINKTIVKTERVTDTVDRTPQHSVTPKTKLPKTNVKNIDANIEMRLVCLMVRDKECSRTALNIVNSTCFSDETCKEIAESVQHTLDNDLIFSASSVIDNVSDENKSRAYDILMAELSSFDILAEAEALAVKVRMQYYARRANEFSQKAKEMMNEGKINDEECQRLIAETARYLKMSKEFKKYDIDFLN